MKKNRLLMVLALFMSLISSSVIYAEGENKSPIIYRPAFEVGAGSVNAGTAFIIKHKNSYYAISAHHLIGTAGGLDKNYTGKELSGFFKKLTLNPALSGYNKIESAEYVSIPNAQPISDISAKNDIFISPLKVAIDSTPFLLASSLPKVGEKVTLYARVKNSNTLVHPATVVNSSPDKLVYVFDDHQLNISATSGAPLINQHFRVAGIHLAGVKTGNGELAGFANPFTSISDNLPK